MNIVVTTITGCRNRGVEALADTIVDQLHAQYPGCSITLLTEDPAFDATRRLASRVTIRQDVMFPGRRPWLKKSPMVRGALKPLVNRQFTDTLEVLRQADIVIATGGDCFSSDYGPPDRWLFSLELAQQMGKPVYFLGQSIGIFKEPAHAEAWKRIAVGGWTTLRESHSLKYVTQDLGIPSDRASLTADVAFLLPVADEAQRRGMWAHHGIGGDVPTVALGISRGVSAFAGANHERHVEVWLETIRMILDEFKAQVLLVPHVQNIAPAGDDRMLATELMQRMNYDPRVKLAGGDHSASDFKSFISGCDMVISERMHACIAGLSSGVCTVAIGYSLKADGIMSDLFGPDVSKLGLLFPMKEFMAGESARAMIRAAWADRQTHSATLKARLPEVRKRAADNFAMVGRIVRVPAAV
jgi:colanic acid/amylovoran biosynthesis protein